MQGSAFPLYMIYCHVIAGQSFQLHSDCCALLTMCIFYPPLSLTRPVLLYSSPFEWKWARVNNVRLPFSTIWTELISIHVIASRLFATAGTKRQRMRNKVNWAQSMTCTLRVTGATLIVACLVVIELQHFLISSRYFIVSRKLDSEKNFSIMRKSQNQTLFIWAHIVNFISLLVFNLCFSFFLTV